MNRTEFEAKVLELWRKSRVPLTETNLHHYLKVEAGPLQEMLDELLESGFLDIGPHASGAIYVVPGHQRKEKGTTSLPLFIKQRQALEEAKRRLLAKRGINTQALESKSEKKKKKKKEQKEKSESRREKRAKKKRLSSPPPIEALETRDDESDEGRRSGADIGAAIVGTMGKVALKAGSTALVALDKPLEVLDRPRTEDDKSILASAGLSLLGPIGWNYAGSFREAVPATLLQAGIMYALPSFLFAPFLVVGCIASAAVGAAYAWQFNRKNGRTQLFLPKRKAKAKKLKGKSEDKE